MRASRRGELCHAAGTPVLHGVAALCLAWCHGGFVGCGVAWHGGAAARGARCWLWHGIAWLCVWPGVAAGAAGHGLAGLQGLRGLAAGCSGAQQEARTKYVLNPGRDHNSPSH